MKLSNGWYDRLKYVAMIGLPALATFIATVGPAWDMPTKLNAAIVTTVVATNTLLGGLIGISAQATIKEEREK